VTSRARAYLPEPAKAFVEQNLDGKTIYELRNMALLTTRKALLNADAKENEQPSLSKVAGEFKDAATSGALFTNALSLGEKAAVKVFGGSDEIPKDAGALRRMYNLSTKVTGGVRTYANNQINSATQKALDMASQRADAAKNMAYGRVNQVKDTVAPVAERIGATPVVPSFVYRLLRGSEDKGMSGASAGASMEKEKKAVAPATVPTTTVRVDIVGMQPSDAPQGTVSSSTIKKTTGPPAPSSLPTPATKDNAQVNMEGSTASFGGANVSMDLKDMAGSSSMTSTEDTGARSAGNLGDAGMGATLTGSEAPTSNKDLDDPSSTQVGKKNKKQQTKL
jgi:hypothetical protein